MPPQSAGSLRFRGSSYNVATACSSGAFAVGLGYDYVVQTGFPCFAVGVDTMVLKEKLIGFNQILAISENNAHPEKASQSFLIKTAVDLLFPKAHVPYSLNHTSML